MVPDISTLMLFALATLALLMIPGPTVMLVVARSLAEGRRIALPLVLGVAAGDFVAASLALAGAGTLLATSAAAFTILKWAGALYLVWIGIKLWRSPPPRLGDTTAIPAAGSARAAFRDGFLVTVFNPKGILFFVAFVPQFISPAKDYLGQAAVFVCLFTLLAIFNSLAFALLADGLRHMLQRRGVLRWMNRIGGGLIVALGLSSLLTRRPAI